VADLNDPSNPIDMTRTEPRLQDADDGAGTDNRYLQHSTVSCLHEAHEEQQEARWIHSVGDSTLAKVLVHVRKPQTSPHLESFLDFSAPCRITITSRRQPPLLRYMPSSTVAVKPLLRYASTASCPSPLVFEDTPYATRLLGTVRAGCGTVAVRTGCALTNDNDGWRATTCDLINDSRFYIVQHDPSTIDSS
jgi:hypothetical protein